jgi:hypothetical protein
MERLGFVGSTAIVLCNTINMMILTKFQMNEREMDLEKSKAINKPNV